MTTTMRIQRGSTPQAKRGWTYIPSARNNSHKRLFSLLNVTTMESAVTFEPRSADSTHWESKGNNGIEVLSNGSGQQTLRRIRNHPYRSRFWRMRVEQYERMLKLDLHASWLFRFPSFCQAEHGDNDNPNNKWTIEPNQVQIFLCSRLRSCVVKRPRFPNAW